MVVVKSNLIALLSIRLISAFNLKREDFFSTVSSADRAWLPFKSPKLVASGDLTEVVLQPDRIKMTRKEQ
jgi:hypothetical protein